MYKGELSPTSRRAVINKRYYIPRLSLLRNFYSSTDDIRLNGVYQTMGPTGVASHKIAMPSIDGILVTHEGGDKICPVCQLSISPCEEHRIRNRNCRSCNAERKHYAMVHSQPELQRCQHYFHQHCIVLWLVFCKATKRPYNCPCPSCRGAIKSIIWRNRNYSEHLFSIPGDLPSMFLFFTSVLIT
jgi:hypothetical protein